MTRVRFLALNLFLIVVLLTGAGCIDRTTPNETDREPRLQIQDIPKQETPRLVEYFPLTLGSSWQYRGEGNEYAAFSREVVRAEGDKRQVREDNGGTIVASVYHVTNDAITKVFSMGEVYEDESYLNSEENEYSIILRTPLEVGAKWSDDKAAREITNLSGSIETPAGNFTDCVVVKSAFEGSTVIEYYKRGVGLVGRIFEAEGDVIKSLLESYDVKR